MTDLALTFDHTEGRADLAIAGGDLVLDDGLGSLALMSLLTDARARPEEVEPGTADLRGWWGDALSVRPLGGLLWTLMRAKATQENTRRAAEIVRRALDWMITDRIAADIDVTATRIDGAGSGATLRLDIQIIRGDGSRIDLKYDVLWRAMA